MTADKAREINKLFGQVFDLDKQHPHFGSMIEQPAKQPGGMTPPPTTPTMPNPRK